MRPAPPRSISAGPGGRPAHVVSSAVVHVEAQGRIPDLAAAKAGSVAGSRAAAGLEASLWLCPIEGRRLLDSTREGMVEGFSLGSYALLVDYTGRLFREGKVAISRELAAIFDRLGTTAESWCSRLANFVTAGSLGASSRGPQALAGGRQPTRRAPPRQSGAMPSAAKPAIG